MDQVVQAIQAVFLAVQVPLQVDQEVQDLLVDQEDLQVEDHHQEDLHQEDHQMVVNQED